MCPYQALTIRRALEGLAHDHDAVFHPVSLHSLWAAAGRGLPRTCVNTLVIFFWPLGCGMGRTGPLWSGERLHGIAMFADRLLGSRLDRPHPALSWALTCGYVNFCWIFFRAGNCPGRRWPCAGPLRGVRSVRWQKSLPPPFRCRRLPGLDATWR